MHDLASIVTLGAVKLAPVYATLFFGALLSRVVLSTGIAETLVTYAAEFGGDKPLVLSLLLCAVVAVLFTTVTGLGAIIMIGTIVLPVMMTVGVPRATSATLFLLAFGLGYILNIAQWKFYSTIFGVDRTTFQSYAFVIFAVQAVVLVVYAVVRARATRDYATKVVPAADAEDAPRKRVGPLALITPVLPLVLLRGFGVDAIVGFALAALYGVLVTRPRDAVKTLIAAWIRGIEDVAPATILMIGIGMLLVAANTPQVQAAVTPLVAAVAPRSPLAYVVLFGLAVAARAVPRAAQPVRRGDRRVHGARDAARAARGRAGRRGDGGGAGAERVRSDQHAERLGRELHRHRRRAHHAAAAAVAGRRRDARRDRRRAFRRRAVRHGAVPAARRRRRDVVDGLVRAAVGRARDRGARRRHAGRRARRARSGRRGRARLERLPRRRRARRSVGDGLPREAVRRRDAADGDAAGARRARRRARAVRLRRLERRPVALRRALSARAALDALFRVRDWSHEHPGARGRSVRARARLRSGEPAADVLLRLVQTGRRLHARAGAPRRPGVRRRGCARAT